MDFRILGPLEAVHDGIPLPLGGPRHRRLLAALLLNADAVVPAGRLIAALWGDQPPRSAPEMLYVRVCELRAALRPARPERNAGLLNRDGGYQLRLDGDGLDAREFDRLATEGARALADGDPETARTRLAEALALWRGPAVAEFADEPFARADVTRLAEARLLALQRRIEADLAIGRHAEVVGELEALVVEHPLREQFWGQLMLALYRAGRSAEAVRAYQTARGVLAEQLGLDPGDELTRLNAAILRRDPSLDPRPRARTAAPGRPRVHLPAPLTSFVGRATEIAEIGALVRAGRLVTLTGAGGVGKSRLALEVASAAREAFPDGVWLVELAALGQDGLVARTVASALGLREHPQRSATDVLVDRLAEARALLVLDNCEHLVAEVAEVTDRLLRGCPGLHVLATSQERIGITGEVLRPVEGLGVPGPDATVEDVAASDAARLLVERAAAVRPGFALTDATAAAVAQICRRLDGLPLAIELAAAGVNAFGVDQIAARLDDRFGLLTRGSRTAPPRHQTLRAVVEWSYERLPAPERRLFDRLAVFVGGFTLADAEAVGGADDQAVGGADDQAVGGADDDGPVGDGLARLVDTSLVAVDGGTPARYRMLETLRAYGVRRLEASGAAEAVRAAHAAHQLSLVESARGALHGAQQPEWLDRLEAGLGNIRAALEWTIGRGDAATAVRLAGSLYPLWDQRGHYREGRRWLERALGLDADVPPRVRARALNSVAGLAVIQGDLARAAAAAEEAARLSQKAGDPAAGAYALQMLGLAAIYAGDLDRATSVLEESLHNARLAGDRWLEGFTLLFLTTASLSRGDYAATARLTEECDAVLRPVGDPEGLAWVWVFRSAAAWQRGDRVGAGIGAAEAVRGFAALGHVWGISIGLFLAGQLAGDAGDRETATALLAASERMRESVGAALLPFMHRWLDEAGRAARAELGAERYDRAWQAGRSLRGRDAIATALRATGGSA